LHSAVLAGTGSRQSLALVEALASVVRPVGHAAGAADAMFATYVPIGAAAQPR
jgi:hypothetical protein